MNRLVPLAAAITALATPACALANAEGPGTPQATAANATFLSNAPAPATGGGVCVIDTGVDTDTDLGPALAGRVAQIGGVPGDPSDMGAISDTGDPLAKHGTYVAGIIASQVDGVGTSGIWPAARIYSNRVFAGGLASTAADYIRAMNWCASQPGVMVINLSLSGLASATTSERANLNDKIVELRGPLHNINVVAAAGNNGSLSTVGYPALADRVLAVGATDATGTLASFSNRGSGLDIATFGTDTCVTTNHGTRLANGAGTSLAAPVVSAVLAALRSYDPTLTPDQAEALVFDNADVVGGVKVLNAAKAFRADATIASMAVSAPVTGLAAAVTSPCEAAPAPAPGGGDGGGSGASGVDASDVPKGKQSQPAQTITVAPTPTSSPIVEVRQRTDAPLAALKPATPVVRSVTHRLGVLTLRVAGYEAGERALYRVTYRVARGTKTRSVTKTFVRTAGTLKVRIPNWTAIRVQLQRPGVGTSQTLVIRPNSDF